MSETYYTLVFIKTAHKLLLGFKKRGFGENTWNGYGGKLEDNEDILDGAIRELYEESNLKLSREDLNYLGVVTYNDAREQFLHKRIVHIFTAGKSGGDLRETEEMRPKWFRFEHLPYENMWPDSKFWLPLVLKDCWLKARFTYKGNCEIEDYEVKELKMAPTLSNGHSCTYGKCGHEKSSEYSDLAICVKYN